MEPFVSAVVAVDSPPPMFFRNDDVGWCNERLFELLDLFDSYRAPIDLAVIPFASGTTAPNLLRRLRAPHPRFALHQHGYRHINHEPLKRGSEFGPARSAREQHQDILNGKNRLAELFGENIDPFFTPPWNRCTRVTAEILREESFVALSRDISAIPFSLPGLSEIPVTIDWLKKRGGTRVPHTVIGRQLAECVHRGEPFGVMLHHAQMSREDFVALAELLNFMSLVGVELQLMRDTLSVWRTPANLVLS